MKLSVTHETRYKYESPVVQAHHMAYLHPLHNATQHVHSYSLDISPAPENIARSLDRQGQERTYFELLIPHDEMVIVAHSELDTTPLPLGMEGKLDNVSMPISLPWQQVVHYMQFEAGQPFDDAREFAQPSTLAPIHHTFKEYAQAVLGNDLPVFELAKTLCQKVYHDFDYVPTATDVSTPPLKALDLRKGVCQDFAQVMIATLRSVGLAARYVSGYLLTEPPPGQPRLIGADASHAWVSVYCPQSGWLEFDPTNNCLAGESHVRLAYGRDYSDVAPLRGVIRGGGDHKLKVAVTIRPDGEDRPLVAALPESAEHADDNATAPTAKDLDPSPEGKSTSLPGNTASQSQSQSQFNLS